MTNVYFNLNQLPSKNDGGQSRDGNRQSRLMLRQGERSENGALSSTCLRSALVPLSFRSRYLRYAAMIICVLAMSVGQAWGTTQTVGYTTHIVTTSKTGTGRNIKQVTGLTVTALTSSDTYMPAYATGDKDMGNKIYGYNTCQSSKTSRYAMDCYNWKVGTQTGYAATNTFWTGFKVKVASGKKFSLSSANMRLLVNYNHTWRLAIEDSVSGARLATSSDYTITNYNACITNDSLVMSLSDTTACQDLTGTFYVKMYFAASASATGKYFCFPTLTVTGDLEDAAAGCANYSFHYGTTKGSEDQMMCFSQVGSSTTYITEEWTIPSSDQWTYVGWQGGWHDDNAKSANLQLSGMRYGLDHSNTLGSISTNVMEGAKGYVQIYSDNNESNKYVGFVPSGYILRRGTDSDGWTSTAFIPDDADDVMEDEWTTPLTSFTADNADHFTYVGLKTASGYVWTNRSETRRPIFLKPNDTWKNDNAKFVMYYWDDSSHSGYSAIMTDPDGDGVYEAWIPNTYSYNHVLFGRLKPVQVDPVVNWDNKWNQTTNQDLPSDKNLFEITGGDGDAFTGSWSVYGSKGKFHIWSSSNTNNWYCQYYPHYVLTYDANGGSGEPSAQSVPVDGTSSERTVDVAAGSGMTAPTGYQFAGWNPDESSADAGTKDDDYDPEDDVTLSADVTVYAVWTPKQCTVTFDNNGGSGTITSVTATYNVAMPTKAGNLPTKSGYDFAGFWDGEGGTGTQYYNADGSSAQNWDKDVTATQTLYAKWTAHTYTVSLELEGGSGTTSISPVYMSDLGTSAIFSAPSLSPYTFGGFYTGRGGTGTQIINKDRKWVKSVEGWTDGTPHWTHTSDETLYAHWYRDYTIDDNGGSADGKVRANYKGMMGDITVPTYSGCTPDGYYAESGCSTLVMATDGTLESNVTNWTSSDRKWIQTGTSKLYAHWKIDAPTISCSRNEVTISTTLAGTTIYYTTNGSDPTTSSSVYSAPFTIDEDKTVKAYAVKSNFTDSDPASASCTYETTYDVSYDANLDGAGGSTTAQTGNFSGDQVATRSCGFSKSNYKFKWWNTEDDGTGEDFYVGEKVTIASADVPLYAQWEEIGSGEAFWVGDVAISSASTAYDVTGNGITMQITRSTNSDWNDNINEEWNQVSKYNGTTIKKAKVLAVDSDDDYIEINFKDGSTINELNLGITSDQTSSQNVVVCYSTTADFTTGYHEFVKVGSTDNVVTVPGHNQSTKSVTDVSPSTKDKYKYVRIYRQLKNGSDYNDTGSAIGTSNKARIYSIKAKKGTACTSPTIGSQPADVAICPGSTTTLTVSSITGGNTPYTYQWYDASDDLAVSSGSGYTTASFTTPTLDAAASYYCIVTENGGCTTQSETADVTMKTTTAITSGPSSVANAIVGSASSLSVTAEGTNLSYQWYTCDDDKKTNADDLDDEKDATLSVTPASVGVTYYYCVVSGDCGTETSDVVSITAKNSISPSLSYASTVTYGSTISPTLSGTGDGSVTYSLNDVSPAGSLTINGSTGVVTGVTAGGTATVTATITAGDDYWGGSATSSTITVTKADLSVSATAGTADDITHNSATLPFTLSSTDGVGSVTLTIYLASDDSEVTSVTGVTAATSGSGEVTGLEANTTYYFTVTPIGDANHNDGTASVASSTFTTSAAPTLSALVAGTLYKVADMVPEGTTITGTDQFVDGLSENTKFFLVGTGSGKTGTTMKVKSDAQTIDAISFPNTYYFGTAATVSSNTPTNYAIKFMIPTGGGALKVYAKGSSAIKLSKEGVAGTVLGSDGTSVYGSYTLDVTAGTWYLYATGGSTAIYGVQLLVMHDLTTTVSGGIGGIVSAASSVAEGGTTIVTATPAKGYVVTNWAVSGTGASITPSGASSSATTTLTMGTTDATVTVTFGKANYNVTYDDNGSTGGSKPTDATDYHYGDKVTVSDNTGTLVKTGYTFRGWTSGDYFYKAGDKFTITDNTTLKAVWENNSGSEAIVLTHFGTQYRTSAPRRGYAYVGSTSGTKYIIESDKSDNKNIDSDSSAIRINYNSYIKVLGPNATTTLSDSLFAGVSAISFDWKFHNSSSEYTTTVDVYVGGTKVASGVSLTGTNKSDYQTKEITVSPAKNGAVQIKNVSPSGSTNYSLYIDNISITSATPNFDVSFANMSDFGGTATLPSTIEGVPTGKKILKPADPTTEGEYVFGGWYKEGSCTNAWNFESDKVTSDVTLYAKWFDADYTITWNVNGSTYATTKACDDVAIVLPTAPADNTLDDCANSFRGWSETNLYGEANDNQPSDLFIDPADAPTIDGNKTFYAVFGTATDAAYKGTVLWSEDWTGATTASSASSSAAPSGQSDYSGKVVYFGGVASYSETTTGTYVRNQNTGGGVAPELMIKASEAWTIAGIPSGGAKSLILSYTRSNYALTPTVSGTDYSISSVSGSGAGTYVWSITCGSGSTFDLTFTAGASNVRLDDIVVKVKEDGATDYRCICPSLEVTPELITASTPIFITSAASKTVRSQDSLLIVGSGLDKSATLTLKSPSSKFALKTRTNEALTTDATGAISAVGYIFYTPDAGDTSDGLDKYSTFTVTDGSNDAEVDQALIGRHLPADFVIAVKRNNKWLALPATMNELSTPSPVEIAVDNIDNPTVAYTANTNIYNLYGQSSGAGYLEEAGQYIKLGMKNNSNKPLFGSTSSTVKGDGDATVTNNIGKQYWWLLTQTKTGDVATSTAQYSISCANNVNPFVLKENAGNPQWGFYLTGSVGPIRIIPAVSGVGFAEAKIVAWGKNSAIIEADVPTVSADYIIGKLPGDIVSSKIALVETGTSVKGTGTRYNYTVNFGVGLDFSANEGKMLTLEWYDGESLVAVSNVTVPRIVASNTTINSTNYPTKSVWNTEVHVLPGDTLTIDASGYSTKNKDVTIKELNIYPGAAVIINKDTLKATNLVLRSGWSRIGEKIYAVGSLYINPGTGNGSLKATNAYMDWYIDYDQYYPIAVPWKVATASISYQNMTVATSAGLKVRYYDGERHAKGGEGNTNWKEYTWGDDMPTNLVPGIGYAITARRPAGKAFSIIRMPLTIPSADWTKNGEQGVVSDVHKDQVSVTAWVKDEGETPDHAKGWNFIANPYMCNYEGDITHEDGDEYNIAYVNIPDVNFKEFDQVEIGKATLKPGSGFLIQTEKTGTLTFGTTNRKASAPSYLAEVPKVSKQKAYITLSGDDAEDEMGLIISERYTAEYEINADLEKLLSDGNTLRTYMIYNNINMAYVAINEDLAREWIPVKVRIPATGEYTFSLHEASKVSELEGIYLIDYTNNVVTNLIENNYSFIATEGTIAGRFAINAIVGKHDTLTDIDIINAGGDIHSDKPVKFIYRDKVYILNRGIIYDTAGKKVREINK